MALVDEVQRVCKRLASKGWKALLAQHGLDIAATNLAGELSRPLPAIDRQLPGFEDFAAQGARAIEPGDPARSLLYHALASPNVVAGAGGKALADFPTLAEIEAVENYVYGVRPPSLAQLRGLSDGLLAIAVVACEYRPGPETPHRKHADLCFARTGIARVGTQPPLYDKKRRGFLPFVDKKPFEMRALPARYAAYVVAQRKGGSDEFAVLNGTRADGDLDFWIPLQKLFGGEECIGGLKLRLLFSAHHRNDKLRRIHLAWKGKGGWGEPDISNEPFVFERGIAELSTEDADGSGLLCPVPRPLAEAARYQGKPLTFQVPRSATTLSSSLYIEPEDDSRAAPEFVHARHLVRDDGTVENLNDARDVVARVAAGGYRAQHYLDYTGDGFIEAVCPELGNDITRFLPAYSLVTAPDFFVNCDQRELFEWSEKAVSSALRAAIWAVPPVPLSDQRLSPNLTLTKKFSKKDKTATAIVSLPAKGAAEQTRGDVRSSMRHSHLPDAAAGLFDPGWDVSRDTTQGTPHLAAYGLGSPFPEDAKLCAALSTFWPAVAPDAARSFEPNPAQLGITPTVAPLTDEEIGLAGGIAWDGLPGPKLVEIGGEELVEYPELDHADYVEAALQRKFSLALTGQIETREYQARVLAMARAYRALGIRGGARDAQLRKKAQWGVLSVRKVEKASAELKTAQATTQRVLHLPVYRFELYRHGPRREHPTDVRLVRITVRERVTLFVDATRVLVKRGDLAWQESDG